MHIRKATPHDSIALAELTQFCFSDTFGHLYSEENLISHLESTCSVAFFEKELIDSQILVAEEKGLVGYIKYGKMELPVTPLPASTQEIHRLYIHPHAQGKGLGRQLMDAALGSPEIASAEHIYLSVYEDNHRAQRFYTHYGFQIISEYDYYVGSHIDREFIMHKDNRA